MGLRNNNGGYLVIGFDDQTLQPDTVGARPAEVWSAFHIDKIQPLVSRFASEAFEVTVEFPERAGQAFPVVVVASGVKTPVAAKSSLSAGSGANLKKIDQGDILIRSLTANNTPSTSKARWDDWPRLMEICFDNREADIGRFLRRHLGGLTPEVIGSLLSSLAEGVQPQPTDEQSLEVWRAECHRRFEATIAEKALALPEHGSWEVALEIIGTGARHTASQNFLNLLNASNPRFTGWPTWIDKRSFHDQESHPKVINGMWEALLV